MDHGGSNSGSNPADNPQQKERLKHRVLKVGESYGNYRVVRCICAGLIANYYHMQHVRDLHDVTVGVFHPRSLKDPRFPKRLQALQKTINGCEHESIPKIRDIDEINERHCIFLDPIKGQTLSRYFGGRGEPGASGIGVGDTSRILAQLLGTLGYAHSMKLDHRDLDSDLIFIEEDGSLRLLGLGIKAAVGVELFESIVSASVSPLVSNKTAGRLNSFDVMSPEYRSGVSEDHRVDIYCAGLIGYWLLTGRKPEPGNPTPPSSLIVELSSNWDVFFEKALKSDRDARYASCKVALIGLKETEREPESERAGHIQRQIDRIPVPKGILARGELAARVYRLSIIGVVGLTLTAITATFLTNAFTETEGYERKVATVAEEGGAFNLRVQMRPSVARLQFVRHKERFLVTEGRVDLRVQPGEYRLLFTAPRHVDETVDLKIESGQTEELSINLRPAWSEFRIVSEPGATIVVVDDQGVEIELGRTDADGLFYLEEGIFAGVYQIIVRKEGYEPSVLENQELQFGELTEIEVPLEALPASLTVRSEPAGARVVVNDEERGVTPLELEGVEPEAPYVIAVHLEGYRSIGRRLTIEAGEDRVVDFGELTLRSGRIELDVEFEGLADEQAEAAREEVMVELDERSIPLEDPALDTVAEGRHQLRLVHPLYISEAQSFVLKDRETAEFQVKMVARPAEVELRLPGEVEAEVRLNGEAVEIDEEGIVRIPAREAVEFELRMTDHLTMTRRFEMAPTERVVWEVDPVPIPGPSLGESWTVPYLGLEFAWVDAGSFDMGSPPPEPGRLPNEGPPTTVRFTYGYWAGVHEVTQAQFRELMGENPSEFVGSRHPVDTVLWEQAQEYCERLTRIEAEAGRLPEGYAYRLPTEAEWEYAARAGTTTPYSFGARADASMGVFRGVYPPGSEEGLRVADHYGTLEVGSFQANPWGLHDVHGNVEEWTLDRYNGRLEGGNLTDPEPRTEGDRMAVRGGSWEDFAVRVRSAARDEARPATESNGIGFRVVLAPRFDE
ncbi:MAG: SUMF1/EgtB/PvdO family nonheme iron enzyme [Opitutales bacterium]